MISSNRHRHQTGFGCQLRVTSFLKAYGRERGIKPWNQEIHPLSSLEDRRRRRLSRAPRFRVHGSDPAEANEAFDPPTSAIGTRLTTDKR